MTLCIAIVSPYGAWMSSDMRLVDLATGKADPEQSTKQFVFKTTDGIATVSYSGIGRLGSGEHISNLLVGLLQGESRSFGATVRALAGFANEQIALIAWKKGVYHSFLIAALLSGKPVAAAVSNVRVVHVGYPKNETELLKEFAVVPVPIGTGQALAVGRRDAIEPADVEMLRRAAVRSPSSPQDFANLLAAVSRRASRNAPTSISGECHVVHLPYEPPEGGPDWHLYRYGWGTILPQESDPTFLLFGMNISAMLTAWVKELPAMKSGSTSVEAAIAGIRLAAGHRVIHVESKRLGTVVADPVTGGGTNDVQVRWHQANLIEIVQRDKLRVLYPKELEDPV